MDARIFTRDVSRIQRILSLVGYTVIEDTRISARILYRWIVTDQRRNEKGETGSVCGVFASERLFRDNVISRLWRFLSVPS